MYLADNGYDALAEILRWEIERGTHRRTLTARGSYLMRLYSRIHDHPRQMAEKLALDKAARR